MSVEAIKAIMRRYVEEVYDGGNLDLVDELIHPEYVLHDPALGSIRGIDGIKQVITATRTAFPNLQDTIEDLMADGDRGVARWTAKGTHQGEFMGLVPTSKQVSVTGTSIYRFAEGKIAEEWKTWDVWGLMQQLGGIK